MDQPLPPAQPVGPFTLAIDIGGTGLKLGVLDAHGHLVGESHRTPTPRRATPAAVVDAITGVVPGLASFDRISVGFPGVVRHGQVLTAPNLDNEAWHHFPLVATLSDRLERPVRMLNDATVQGLGVIAGHGVECVLTLGTGMGFALFQDGRLTPHLELSHHPVHKRKDYDQYIGNAALYNVGRKRWNRRVQRALGHITALVGYDTLYIGGGNARHIRFDLPANVHIVSNKAGVTGGVRLWDPALDPAFATPTAPVRIASTVV
jgi:polyphosphate glucokinase